MHLKSTLQNHLSFSRFKILLHLRQNGILLPKVGLEGRYFAVKVLCYLFVIAAPAEPGWQMNSAISPSRLERG